MKQNINQIENSLITKKYEKQKKNSKKEPIKMVDLYSYWITFHFILYKLFEKKAFHWMSPYPALLIGFFIQLIIFYNGRKTLKLSFIIAVFIWKLLMLVMVKYNMKWTTILANLSLFFFYIVFIKGRNIDLINLYTKGIYETEKSKKTLIEFLIFRLNNIY